MNIRPTPVGISCLQAGVDVKEPVRYFDDLFIEDMLEMAATGRMEEDVLLWMQEGYVSQAIATDRAGLYRQYSALGVEGVESMREVLADAAKSCYAADKARGGGADMKGYLEAAHFYFGELMAHFEGQLAALREYLERMTAFGCELEVGVWAREAYVALAKFVSAAQGSMSAGEPGMDERVKSVIGGWLQGVCADRNPVSVGGRLIGAIEAIAAEPGAFLNLDDPALGIPSADPGDFAPLARQEMVP
jgi:hypothetical protein